MGNTNTAPSVPTHAPLPSKEEHLAALAALGIEFEKKEGYERLCLTLKDGLTMEEFTDGEYNVHHGVLDNEGRLLAIVQRRVDNHITQWLWDICPNPCVEDADLWRVRRSQYLELMGERDAEKRRLKSLRKELLGAETLEAFGTEIKKDGPVFGD